MHQGFKEFIENRLTYMFSCWVKPDVLPAEPSQLINSDTPILYVLEKGGVADRAALSIVCKELDLPSPASPLVFGQQQESSSIDSLMHRRGFIFRRRRLVTSQRLTRLIDSRLNTTTDELQIVPVAVYWGRAPNKERSIWSLFFSENWHIGGRFKKFITTLVYGRDTLLSFSEPLSLNAFLEGATEPRSKVPPNTEKLQRKLSRILRVHFRQRRIASLGPDQSHRRMLLSQVSSDPGVRAVILNSVNEDNKKFEREQAKANKYALEIAADVSYPTVRVLHRVMNRLWTELYDGVELHGIDRLRSAADGKELVYVPCHRSHIDYLLLSYILYINGFSLPHIAAGINLNLPVVGGLLRRGGAFFLRRSFRGNKLYAAVFNAYLREILQRGHSLEYFVEGGRSRTGRSLPPKGGMLAMTAHAYLHNPQTPVVFIPVYFGYERLLEGRAFTSELAGGKKQKESIFALLKSLKTLRENYGHVHVNFGQPIELDALLDKHQASWRTEAVSLNRPKWLVDVVDDLGVNIMQNINDAACVTPINLLAMALLATRQGMLGRSELIDQIKVYQTLFTTIAQSTTAVVPTIDPQQAIDLGKKLGFIQTNEDELGTLVSIKPGMAAPLTYFRNNVQHLITAPSLVACCFTAVAVQTKTQLIRVVNYAYPFLQNELYISPQSTESILDEALESLIACGLIQAEKNEDGEHAYRRAGGGTVEAVTLIRLAESVMPALERYLLAAAVIMQHGSEGLTLDELAERCKVCAQRLALTQGRDAGDLYDKHLHNAMINQLSEASYVSIDVVNNRNSDATDESNNGGEQKDGITTGIQRIRATEQFLTLATDTRSLVSEQMRQAILHVSGRFSNH